MVKNPRDKVTLSLLVNPRYVPQIVAAAKQTGHQEGRRLWTGLRPTLVRATRELAAGKGAYSRHTQDAFDTFARCVKADTVRPLPRRPQKPDATDEVKTIENVVDAGKKA